jgi:hypothetical protein
VLVAHACRPSYSEGRDQEDCGLKPAQANSLQDPISKKSLHKNRTDGVAQDESPKFKPHYNNNNNNNKTILIY